ncbi:MAG: Methylated-DNA--protein-cysteine methyltransferase [Nitrospira sp.]|nr:MAG: Methylated-DNA--protein-cysteine methyltransferase [Nitrospira sp.]
MEQTQWKIETKIGTLYLVASLKGLKRVCWVKQDVPFEDGSSLAAKVLSLAEQEIHEYLNGSRKKFSVQLDPDGTDFQKKVWKRVSKIPFGETRSYKDIATELGAPNSSRAVGAANGKNPLCLVVSCHRVISSDGSLGGYSGGLERKEHLLKLERENNHENNQQHCRTKENFRTREAAGTQERRSLT